MKKLLVFHPTIAPYRVDFFNDLNDRYDMSFCLMNPYDNTFNYDLIFNKLIFKPSFLSIWFSVLGRQINKGYWKNIDDFNPDLIMVSEFGICTVMVLAHRFLKRKRYKVVSLCDDSYSILNDSQDFTWWHKIARRLMGSWIDELIVVEPRAKQWFMDNYRKGFCMPIIRDENNMRSKLQEGLSISGDIKNKYRLNGKFIYVFVGRFIKLKNIPVLLQAFSKIEDDRKLLVLIGSGEEEKNIRGRVKSLSLQNVIFTGRLEDNDLYPWYNVANCLILPSYLEPFGAVVNEALLAGCHCVVSNVAGAQCLIKEGFNGYLFNPVDADELANKMEMVFEQNYKESNNSMVKPNLMIWNYNQCVNDLFQHLQELIS